MMHTIRVDRVLRETVNTSYSDLVTRATGRAVRSSIRQTIAGLEGGTALLDFSSVGLVDFSCADEVVAQLLLEKTDDVIVVLGGLREDHTETIEHVLTHHALAVVVQESPDGCPRLLGLVDREAQEVFERLHAHGAADAETMGQHLGWDAERAQDALDTLVRLRLVRQEGLTFAPLPLP
jgi:hypothetical protein